MKFKHFGACGCLRLRVGVLVFRVHVSTQVAQLSPKTPKALQSRALTQRIRSLILASGGGVGLETLARKAQKVLTKTSASPKP